MTGSFTFKWAQPAGEVYVTGSFDDWGKSTKLDKEGDAFVATVLLPFEKILYKYVVDGNWTIDITARREAGDDGIENNVLLPEDLITEKTELGMSSAAISTVAPDSTTAALAAEVPKETNGSIKDAAISSAAPDSTTAAFAAGAPLETKTPSLNGVPGGFPRTPVFETSDPTPVTSPEDLTNEMASADPIPASATMSNPIDLAPGQPVPKPDDNAEDINGGVKLDVGANVPEIVNDSWEKADVPPEASTVPEAVEQKKEVEEELKEGVPVAQPITEGNTIIDQVETNAAVAAPTVITAVGGIAAAAGLSSASGEKNDETTSAIAPEVVKQSQEAAHVSPEASAVESAVEAKKEFESELKQEVSPVSPIEEFGEPAMPAEQVPEIVRDSLAKASSKPEAAGVGDAIEAKTAMESQLKDEVKPIAPIELNTSADNSATSAVSVPKLEVTDPQATTTPLSPTSPVEPAKNGTSKTGSPRKGVENGDSPASPTQLTKKKNRFNFLGSLKDKLHFGKDKGKSKGEMSP